MLGLAYGKDIGKILNLVGRVMSTSRDAGAQRALINGTVTLLALALKARKEGTLSDALQRLGQDGGEEVTQQIEKAMQIKKAMRDKQ